MQNRRTMAMMAMLVGASLLGACSRTAPLVAETGSEFLGRANIAQRTEQIRAAAAGLGWTTDTRQPGVMRATLNLRTHQAVVDILYDTQRFTIRYVESTNLDYDGTMIHRNYNSWVHNLQTAIVTRSGA
jgi:hypothetical protein